MSSLICFLSVSFCDLSTIDPEAAIIKIILEDDPHNKKELLIKLIDDFNQIIRQVIRQEKYYFDDLQYPAYWEKYVSVLAFRRVILEKLGGEFPDLDLSDVPVVLEPRSVSYLMTIIALIG